MSKVIIAIVNWNTGQLLTHCLESLVQLPDRAALAGVVVVDNASHDTSLSQARHSAAATSLGVKFVAQAANTGFAAATNRAVREVAPDHPTAHVLLLNPDTTVHNGALAALLAELASRDDIGIVGPHLQNPDRTTQPSVRRFPSRRVLLILLLKLRPLLSWTTWWRAYMATDFDYGQAAQVDQVMGAAFLVRRAVWDQLRGLDESFYVWFEEVDFCRRAQRAGWRIRYTPTATVEHVGGVSFGQLHGWRKTWPWVRSLVRYTRKHHDFLTAAVFIGLTPLALGISVLKPAWQRHA